LHAAGCDSADDIDGMTVFRHPGFRGLEALVVPARNLIIVAATLEHSRARALHELVNTLAREALTESATR